MDEKLNQFLIEEIQKGISKLQLDKEQLEGELAKYEGRDGVQGIENFKTDLVKIDDELGEKNTELEQIQTANETKARIEEEENSIQEQYEKLLREKEQCEAEIQKLSGKMELKDGRFVPTREQEEFQKDLEKISASISKFDLLKNQHKEEMQKQEQIVETLYEKYGIRSKYDAKEAERQSQEEQMWDEYKIEQRKQEENQMWDEYKDLQRNEETEKQAQIDEAYEQKNENEEIEELTAKYAGMREADEYFNSVEQEEADRDARVIAEMRTRGQQGLQKLGQGSQGKAKQSPQKPGQDKLTSILCTVKNGSFTYVISFKDEKGEEQQFELDQTHPHKMNKQEKENLKRVIAPSYFHGVDIEVANALSRNDILKDSNLYSQYINYVRDMMNGNEKLPEDIEVTYDLENLRDTDLNRKEKRFIKKLAKNSEAYGIADYVKPKGRFKAFWERITQKKLEKGDQAPNLSQDEEMVKDLQELGAEEGFDINQFIQQQELISGKALSLDQKNKLIQEHAKINGNGQDDIRKRVRVGLNNDSTTRSPQPETGKETSEPSRPETGREPGDD